MAITLTAAWAAGQSCAEMPRARQRDPLNPTKQLVFFHTCRVVVQTGTNTLPLDSPVEVEAIITVKPA